MGALWCEKNAALRWLLLNLWMPCYVDARVSCAFNIACQDEGREEYAVRPIYVCFLHRTVLFSTAFNVRNLDFARRFDMAL